MPLPCKGVLSAAVSHAIVLQGVLSAAVSHAIALQGVLSAAVYGIETFSLCLYKAYLP